MKVFLKLLVISTLFDSSKAENFTKDSQLSQAIAGLIKSFYLTKDLHYHLIKAVSEKNQHQFNEVASEVIKSFLTTVNIESCEKKFKHHDRRRFSLITFTDSVKSLMNFYEKLSPDKFRFRRYFTDVFMDEVSNEELEVTFKLFWKISIKNVNSLVHYNNSTINLYTFLPFNHQKCADTSAMKINGFDRNQMKWENNLFQPSKTKNLHKCTVTVSCAFGTAEPEVIGKLNSNGSLELSGFEKDFYEEVPKQLNFRPKFEAHGTSCGLLYENGSATGGEETV